MNFQFIRQKKEKASNFNHYKFRMISTQHDKIDSYDVKLAHIR